MYVYIYIYICICIYIMIMRRPPQVPRRCPRTANREGGKEWTARRVPVVCLNIVTDAKLSGNGQ